MFLSIVTPCYNPGALLMEAMESAAAAIRLVARRHPEVTVEQIVFDDGSDDPATLAAFDDIRARFPHCRLLGDDLKKQGPASARNRAVAAARGDWIGFLDADDRVHAEGMAALVATALAHEDARWVMGDTERFTPDGLSEIRRLPCATMLPAGSTDALYIPPAALLSSMAGPPSLFLGSMIVRTELFHAAGAFDGTLLCGEDWFLTLSAALHSGAYYVPVAVECLRRGHASLTQSAVSLSAVSFRATVKAFRDRRFASVRKELRWTLLAQLSNIRDRCRAAGLRWRACKFELMAWAVAPENPRLLKDALACLSGRPGG